LALGVSVGVSLGVTLGTALGFLLGVVVGAEVGTCVTGAAVMGAAVMGADVTGAGVSHVSTHGTMNVYKTLFSMSVSFSKLKQPVAVISGGSSWLTTSPTSDNPASWIKIYAVVVKGASYKP
jgi:hypothetical protein